MKVGITLPQFRHDADAAIETAASAEAAGLDGLFVFDHLWPIGRPDRPALSGLVLAAALAGETRRVAVGTLVARVGVLPDAVLASTFATLGRIAGDRLIAGLGIGDRLSRPENLAYGVPLRPRAERLARLENVCGLVRSRGITTWVGGRSPATRALARTAADGLNLWGAGAAEVAEVVAEVAAAAEPLEAGARGRPEVTWAGQVDLSTRAGADIADLLQAVSRAGATWAVVAPVGAEWPEAVESIAAAAGALVD